MRLRDRVRVCQTRGSALCEFRAADDARAAVLPASTVRVHDLAGAPVRAVTRGRGKRAASFGVEVGLERRFLRLFFPTAAARDAALAQLSQAAATRSLARYAPRRVLGEGGYGKVFSAVDQLTQRHVAIKQVGLRTSTNTAHVINERVTLERARGSPFLGGMLASFVEGGRLYYVLPEARTDLFDYQRVRGRMVEREALFVAAQLVLGLGHLHGHRIAHRDVKLENVVMGSDGTVSLIDFGLSAHFPGDRRAFDVVGTDHYMPPEMLQRGMGHSLPTDWWQLGCLLFELVAGRPPFYSRAKANLRQRIGLEPVRWPPRVRERVSAPFVELVEALLDKEWWHRLGTQGGAEAVAAHRAFRDIPWAALRRGDASAAPYACPDKVMPAHSATQSGEQSASTATAAAAVAAAAAATERFPATWAAASKGVPACPAVARRLVGFAFEPPAEAPSEEEEEEVEAEKCEGVVRRTDAPRSNDAPRSSPASLASSPSPPMTPSEEEHTGKAVGSGGGEGWSTQSEQGSAAPRPLSPSAAGDVPTPLLPAVPAVPAALCGVKGRGGLASERGGVDSAPLALATPPPPPVPVAVAAVRQKEHGAKLPPWTAVTAAGQVWLCKARAAPASSSALCSAPVDGPPRRPSRCCSGRPACAPRASESVVMPPSAAAGSMAAGAERLALRLPL